MWKQKRVIANFLCRFQDMGRTMVIVAEKYTDNVREIQNFLQKTGLESKIIIFDDEGFLPADVITPYEYFVLQQNPETVAEKPLFYNFIKVPAFWEIRADGVRGGIYDMGCRKAVICFAQPVERRNVQRVEWCAENGWVYRTDYYNKYGLKFAADFFNVNGEVESRVFYSCQNQEIIVIQPQNDTVTLLEEGRLQSYFTSYDQFTEYFLEKAVTAETYILLIQNERQIEQLLKEPERKERWKCVMFQEGKLLQAYLAAGGNNGCRFYEDPGRYPVNHAEGKVLILTASDQIAGIEYLISGLPEVTFCIAANTQVSDKLHRLDDRENVLVYPQISQNKLEELWSECDFYLDINYYREIYDAVNIAHRRNLLIMGFEDTLHDKDLVAEECVFHKSDYEGMVRKIKALLENADKVQPVLQKQQGRRAACWRRLAILLGLESEGMG